MTRVILMFGIVTALLVPAAATASSSSSTITVKSYDQHLRITLLGWTSSTRGSDAYDTPAAGKKYLAVKLRITNLSSKTYSDAPTNGATLQDTSHRSYDAAFGGPEPSLQGSVRILPHDWEVGWITFEVPMTVKPRLFAYTLDSGFADEATGTGVWRF
jgi:Domain of unknown function (DUF4352)